VNNAKVQRSAAIQRRQHEHPLPRLEEADMKQRLAITAIAMSVPGLLCACATGGSASPAASSLTSPAAVTRTGPATVVAYVKGFYRSYVAARKLGQRAAAAVVRSHVAAWYFPILEAPYTAGVDPVECGLRDPVADWRFKQAGVLGGQAVIVIGSQPPGAPQELWIVATTVPGTGKITGITCSAGGANVTSTGARDAATSWYSPYITARREGASPQDAIARLTHGGPAAGDPYLQQVSYAIARQHLGYDPVTCATAGVPDVSAGRTRVVAGNSAGVVVIAEHRTQFLVTVVLGAKGWTVGDIACSQRP
jgi:hypothetical protein